MSYIEREGEKIIYDSDKNPWPNPNEKKSLFIKKDFISHSGLKLNWKIDCDALTNEDIETLAFLISEKWDFGNVIGIPNGGLRLAAALKKYKNLESNLTLVIDDVYTTGKSMREWLSKYTISHGVAIFARNVLPKNVDCIFKLNNFIS